MENLKGFVDKMDGDIAYVTLETASGDLFYDEFPARVLTERGICEGRRFKLSTDGAVVVVEAIPDRELGEEREQQIDAWLRKSLGDEYNQ